MKNLLFALASALLLNVTVLAQTNLLTIAESSDYTKTSTHQNVLDFMIELDQDSPYLRIETIGNTTEGKPIPMLILANPMLNSPEDLMNDDRLVIYIQANIHSGEVEGKEASQALARELIKNPDSDFFKNLIILIVPDLNADGNDKMSDQNRTNQNGPKSVGVRHNGQQLDINRDAMKLETPEMQAVVSQVYNSWDPAIVVDMHTTNGSYHVEPVTFTWQMNPNGDRNLINYMRDKMMPLVSETLREKYKTLNCFYGEFVDRGDRSKGWISYASETRYMTNYVGVRNRLSILNENYVYADYKSRVIGSYNLLLSILDFAVFNKNEIKNILANADQKSLNRGLNLAVADSFALKYKGRPTPNPETIMTYEVEPYKDVNGRTRYKKTDKQVNVTIPYIADYYATKQIAYPFAYILDINDKRIISHLQLHGIEIKQLNNDVFLEVESYKISNLKPAERLNQGHYLNTVKGEYVVESKEFKSGTYYILSSQKLGSLAAYLLEAESDDGLLKWNFFDRYIVPQWGRNYFPYPVYRLLQQTEL
ncbi:MAG: M14 family metallopeptidase [Bacteroidales bacterium]|jgi:dipeptidyl-peptidase-4|nr:M14 family metallopeptidase [Bacteroidales bacterium]